MIRTLSAKIAATAAGLVLGGAAAAAAVASPPEAADKGLTTAEEHTGFAVPASPDTHPGGGVEDDVVEDEVVEGEGGGPVDNHGAAVSAVATDHTLTGRAHGEAVSEVASGDHGKPEGAANGGGDDEVEDASENGAGNANERAALGSGNAGGHGRP